MEVGVLSPPKLPAPLNAAEVWTLVHGYKRLSVSAAWPGCRWGESAR